MHGDIQRWLHMQIEEKVLNLASLVTHMRKDLRLGAVVGMYLMF